MTVLQPFFSLTPLDRYVMTYDAGAPTAPWVAASLTSYGGYTGSGHSLQSQYDRNEIILRSDPVPLDDVTFGEMSRRCSVWINIQPRRVSVENQCLLLIALRGISGSPSAQIFVGSDLVRTEALSGDETVAILVDCPEAGGNIDVYVRLASSYDYAVMGFKGIDCYLL
jgi:hypothetical protein